MRLIKFPGQTGLRYLFKIKKGFTKKGEFIFIASMPKSASTFLLRLLEEVTGFRITQLCYAFERHEQNLNLPRLIDAYSQNTTTRHHTKATGANLEILKMFEIRPIILVRNIFDIVPSTYDYLFKEGFEKFPAFYCNEQFSDLDITTQLDCIIEIALPWFFNFYVSWFEACESGKIDALWLEFEQVVADWPGALKKVLDFYGIVKTDKQIEEAVQRTRKLSRDKLRLNRGITGRGKAVLDESQYQKIVNMKRFYPWVDFSKIGI